MQPRSVKKLYTPRILVLVVIVTSFTAGFVVEDARAKTPRPVQRPPGLLQARAQCPPDATLTECRAALRRALAAASWQKQARLHAKATTVREITLDAIAWAAAKYHVSAADMRTVANCESHLWPFATNGQYKGVWQLGAMHRGDPIFDAVPWQDAYGQASHVARFVRTHSWSQWQCRPQGGLRW